MESKRELTFDVIILGAGPAGFSAAIFASRSCCNTAIIDTNIFGGQPSNYLEIENYPGFLSSNSCELMEKFEEHADKFGTQKFPMTEIQKINLSPLYKEIETPDTVFKAKTVIIATGASPKKLNIKGEAEFKCRGVSYCAVCDGAFYKDKTLAVVGGGNSALEEAIYLTKFAKKVYVIHKRNEFRADKIIQQRAKENPKIEFILNAMPIEIAGSSTVENVILKNVETENQFNLQVDGVFPYIGVEPNTEMFSGQLKLTKEGFIETDVNMQTSIAGVYAAGDVRNTPLRQVITAAADGACAACNAVKYAETQEYKQLSTN